MVCCSVCVEEFTKEKRKRIDCDFCSYSACAHCVKQYIMSSPDSPHCMNCRKGWGRLTLSKKFSQSFMKNEYKRAREDILYTLERSMFPETQPYIENRKVVIANGKKIYENDTRIRVLKRELNRTFVVDLESKKIEMSLRMQMFTHQLENEYLRHENDVLNNNTPVDRKSVREFVKSCAHAGCKGFLSTQWKCGICDLYTCKECHEPKNEDHVCDQNNVETVKHLKSSEYKACPACGIHIFKISGCSQMYCTNPTCRKAFDWGTGKIVTGRIHNPHYYEYMRDNNQLDREIGDIQCGGLVSASQLYHALRDHKLTLPTIRAFTEFHRRILEFQETVNRPQPEINVFDVNLNERIEHMCGTKSENVFKAILQQREKSAHKRREILMVGTTFIQIMTDIYGRIVSEKGTEVKCDEIMNACTYCNTLWREIGNAYNCVVPMADFLLGTIKNVKV